MKVLIRISVLFGLVIITMAGCALGPNYVKPDVQVPKSYKVEAPWKKAEPRDRIDKGEWWKVFGDPVLNDLEEQVAENNQEIKAAVARVTQARALAGVSEADFLPRIDLNPSASRSRTAADFSETGEGITANAFRVPFDLSYELDIWGRVRRSFEASTAEVRSSASDYHTVMLTLQAETARNYFILRALDAEIELLQKTVELRRENLALLQSRFRNGQISQLDVDRAETELATTEAEAVGLQKQRSELENALAVLAGKTASEFSLPPASIEFRMPEISPGLPSVLLERRPDVASAERRMAAANARIGVATTAFFPAISLTGSAGYASTETSSLFKWDSRTWGLGPAVSLPIFEAGRNTANLNRAKAAYEETAADYRQQVLTAFQEVEDALSGVRILAEQQAIQDRAVKAAQRAAEISKKRYEAGYVSYLEVVDSERTALQTERAATRILRQRLETSVLLIKALGGGWMDASQQS